MKIDIKSKKQKLILAVVLSITVIMLALFFVLTKPKSNLEVTSGQNIAKKLAYTEGSNIYLKIGESVTKPAYTGVSVSSDNINVATISTSGNTYTVTARNIGSTTVRVNSDILNVYVGYSHTLDRQGGLGGTQWIFYQNNCGAKTSDGIGNYLTSRKINVPSKSGYVFTGYWSNSSGSGTQYVDSQGNVNGSYVIPTSNNTWYAGWRTTASNMMVQTLDKQGGTGGSSSIIYLGSGSPQTNDGISIATHSINIPSKTGYTFSGYWSQTNGKGDCYVTSSGAVVLANASSQITSGSHTWYAYWIPSGSGGTTTADFSVHTAVDGIGLIKQSSTNNMLFWVSPSGGTYNVKFSNPSVSYTSLSGYQWQINGTLPIGETTITVTHPTNGKSVAKTITVLAPERYTVSYNANGGSGAPASQTKTESVALTLSSVRPTRNGYNFLGWSTNSNATSATYSAGGTYNVDNNVTLYAVWQAIPVTSVTLNSNTINLNVSEVATLIATVQPSNATNKTVIFSSNNTSVATVNSSTGEVRAVGPGEAVITVTTVDGNKTSMCKVKVIQPVTGITLNTTSSTSIKKGQKISVTATVQPSNATNKVVTFSSSNTSVATVDNSGVITAINIGDAIITATETTSGKTAQIDITVEAPDLYTIRYDVNGGNGQILMQTKLEGEAIKISNTRPTKEGYNFLGWSTNNTATSATYLPGDMYNTDSDLMLYAVWEEIRYLVESISLDKNMLELEINGTYKLTPIINPENASNKEVEFSSSKPEIAMVENDGTVVAKSVGDTVITVKTIDGNKTATCNVIVKEKTLVDTKKPEISKVEAKLDSNKNYLVYITATDESGIKIVKVEGKDITENITEDGRYYFKPEENKDYLIEVTDKNENISKYTYKENGLILKAKADQAKDSKGENIVYITTKTNGKVNFVKVESIDITSSKLEDGRYLFKPEKNGTYKIEVMYEDKQQDNIIYEETRFVQNDENNNEDDKNDNEDDEKYKINIKLDIDENDNKIVYIESESDEKIQKVTVEGKQIEKNESGKYIFGVIENGEYKIIVTYENGTTKELIYEETRFTQEDKKDKEDEKGNTINNIENSTSSLSNNKVNSSTGKTTDTTTALKTIPKTGIKINIFFTLVIGSTVVLYQSFKQRRKK